MHLISPRPTGWATAALLLALVPACAGPTECCLIDTTAEAVLLAEFRDEADQPIAGAEIRVSELLAAGCETDVTDIISVPELGISGADGAIAMRLTTAIGAGEHCIDVEIRVPAVQYQATLPDVPVQFRHASEPQDTAHVDVVVRR